MDMNLYTPHKIFSQVIQPELAHDHKKISSDYRWLEFVHQISRLELANLPETKSNLELLLREQTDPTTRAILYVGISRYYKGIGNLQKTANTLGHAYSLIRNLPASDAHAYISIEMSTLLSITGNIEYAQVLLENIPELTGSESLMRYAHFRYLENKMRLGKTNIISELEASLQYFRNVNDMTTVANHLKAIGNAYRRKHDFDAAMQRYVSAIEIALTHGYPHIATSVEHDVGMLYHHMQEHDLAVAKLHEVIANSDNYYVKCIALSNVGFIELKAGNQEEALNHFIKALSFATEYGTYHRITGLSHYIGLIYDDMGELDLSRFFHDQGFKAAMSMVENHFPCSGDTLRAIKGHQQFYETHSHILLDMSTSVSLNWEQMINKSLKEAKDLFQGALINDAIEKFGSKRNAAKQLGLSERSIFTVLERIVTVDQDKNSDLINNFIQTRQNLSWKKINQEFEVAFIDQVFQQGDRNVRQLAVNLDISYSSAAAKIQALKKSKHENV